MLLYQNFPFLIENVLFWFRILFKKRIYSIFFGTKAAKRMLSIANLTVFAFVLLLQRNKNVNFEYNSSWLITQRFIEITTLFFVANSNSFIWRKAAFKSFHLHVCKLEWFEGKQIWEDGNINICWRGPYRAVHSAPGPVNSQLSCVQQEVRLSSYEIFFGRGSPFWISVVIGLAEPGG